MSSLRFSPLNSPERFIASHEPWILSIWLYKSLLHTTFLPQTVQCHFGFYLNQSFDVSTHVKLGFFPFHEPGKLVFQRIHGRFLCIFNFNFFGMNLESLQYHRKNWFSIQISWSQILQCWSRVFWNHSFVMKLFDVSTH